MIAVIALTGLGVLMYPSTAAWWSQWNQSRIVVDYSAEVKSDRAPGNEDRLQRAREYNELLGHGEIEVGAGQHKPTTSASGSASKFQ